MPIYMDRHYIEGASKHSVENAHLKDLKIQDKYGVNFMTYWFDEERSTAFCLVDAPDAAAVRHVHSEAHGLVPHEIIPVDPAIVEAFLGRIKDPLPVDAPGAVTAEPPTDSAYRIIMFTDIKDSTAMAVRYGDEKAMHLLRIHNAFTRNALRDHHGREVKTTGDGFLISFASATDAVKCAVGIQETLSLYNEENPAEMIQVRIGMSAGEPVDEDGDLYGAAVNLAARICDYADPDKILVSQEVRDHCVGERLSFLELAEMAPKGFDQAVKVYEVVWKDPRSREAGQ